MLDDTTPTTARADTTFTTAPVEPPAPEHLAGPERYTPDQYERFRSIVVSNALLASFLLGHDAVRVTSDAPADLVVIGVEYTTAEYTRFAVWSSTFERVPYDMQKWPPEITFTFQAHREDPPCTA